MIVRILNEGQWHLDEAGVAGLNQLDAAVEKAVTEGDQEALTAALQALLDKVRTGQPVPDDSLEDSDLILPDSDATVDEVRQMLDESAEGLIPG